MTCKLGLAVGLGFFQLRVHTFILHICPLATDVYFENWITKPCHVGHPPS